MKFSAELSAAETSNKKGGEQVMSKLLNLREETMAPEQINGIHRKDRDKW